MNYLEYIAGHIYAYCTDFIINLSNLLHLSYYEVNALIFCMIWPIFTLSLIVLNLYQFLRNIKSRRSSLDVNTDPL
jgi:hypothetical protein